MVEQWNIATVGWSDLGGAGDGMHLQDGRIYLTDRLGGGLHILELAAGAEAARPIATRVGRPTATPARQVGPA